MICCKCGRRLTRAAALVTSPDMNGLTAPVGPTCARQAGLIQTKPRLFTVRARRVRATAQMALPLEVA